MALIAHYGLHLRESISEMRRNSKTKYFSFTIHIDSEIKRCLNAEQKLPHLAVTTFLCLLLFLLMCLSLIYLILHNICALHMAVAMLKLQIKVWFICILNLTLYNFLKLTTSKLFPNAQVVIELIMNCDHSFTIFYYYFCAIALNL